MNSTEMSTTQDAGIVSALGLPLDVLYARAAAGTADSGVQRVLELRSFLAVIEDQAGKARDRIHGATGPQADLYSLSGQDLRFQTALLESAQEVGRRYEQMLRELLPAMSTPTPSQRRPDHFTRSKIATISPLDGGPAAELAGVGAGRHRR